MKKTSKNKKEKTMTTAISVSSREEYEALTQEEKIVNMLIDIDQRTNRTAPMFAFDYDKKTLRILINKGYVAITRRTVTRRFHGTNYDMVTD